MFRHIAPGPQPAWKRPLYLVLTVTLGLVVSYGLHALLELWYLQWAERNSLMVTWYTHGGLGSCALHPAIQYGLLAGGLIGGWLTGRVWWNYVYVSGGRWQQPQK